MKSALVYSFLNPITGLRYIGYTTKTLEWRFAKHCKDAFKGSKYKFHRAIAKHGADIWIPEILEETTRDKVSEREIFWISHFNTFYNGYNLTHGGDGRCFIKGRKQTAEHLRKRMESFRRTLDIHGCSWVGRPNSPEQREQIRKTLTCVKHTAERRKNQSEAAKNRMRGVCIHCQAEMDLCNLRRWHNENCKSLRCIKI